MARSAVEGRIKILTSVNLRALLSGELDDLKRQPATVSHAVFQHRGHTRRHLPLPRLPRGCQRQRLPDPPATQVKQPLMKPSARCHVQSTRFHADKECSVIACFYHHTNWWMENFIQSEQKTPRSPTGGGRQLFPMTSPMGAPHCAFCT